MSYADKSIVISFDVFINGDENVNVLCFVFVKSFKDESTFDLIVYTVKSLVFTYV